MSQEETRRAVELPRYFSVLPAFRGFYRTVNYKYEEQVSDEVNNPYVSAEETPMSKDELRTFLIKNRLLESEEQTDIDRRYWPGDKEEKKQ
ncbi:polysaccharide biosynthesis protein CapD [Candidatus Thiomargarita nelsonii]|uniref:Polysaccharide biosynthesis protein CapD n=1 Tax=Candidatus Thiomargarita nelsonii TaxID=1003181 RepID=A0A176S688_9GAMM|nr:polysaccharide biosynthesis protein CapD [Candidatus Thiomargarita nelsonii]